jgi:chromosome partitioning protein
MFSVITLATSKGGVGKSRLGRSLAAHWFTVGHKPALVDADPQRSLANRYDSEGRLGAVPVVAEPEERLGEVIENCADGMRQSLSIRRLPAMRARHVWLL